ncbi:MAG: hypothetical protein M1825_003603 [Sarcosagium campestre]|nr:MAG: hypothetical protein M1825_003603 [Sarcosagium campestre]
MSSYETNCTISTCSLKTANVHYLPTLEGNALYLTIFAILLPLQIFLTFRHRTWGYGAGMVAGLILEVCGYIGRILMHHSPWARDPFLLYIVSLTVGPACFSAAVYLCLGRLVLAYDDRGNNNDTSIPGNKAPISRLEPRLYTIIFMTCDFVALLLQAVGGALASSAETQQEADIGVNVMLAGLAWQVFSLLLFIVIAADFLWKAHRTPESERSPRHADLRAGKGFRVFISGLAVATVTIFVRCVFRVAELSEGFDGKLANEQVTYMILEGAMIVTACTALTVVHPGLMLGERWNETDFALFPRKKDASVVDDKDERAVQDA